MNHLFKSLFILVLLSTSCQNKEKILVTDVEEFKAVKNVVKGVFDEVWGNKKEAAIFKYQTKDFLLLEHGKVWTNDTILNWCKRAKLKNDGVKRTNSFHFIKAKKEGNRIWMAYHNYATFKKDTILGEMQWLESVIAVKKDTVWKLEMMHSTRKPRK